MKFVTLFVCLLTATALTAQFASGKTIPDLSNALSKDFNDVSYKLSTTISTSDLKEHIFTLASDEFEGRETGTSGNNTAAKYIADHFEKLGLPKIVDDQSYFQSVAFTFTSWNKLTLNVSDVKYKLLKDFIAFPQYSKQSSIEADEIVFLGYGIEDDQYSDYQNIEVKDKVVMVYDGEPVDKKGASLVSGSSELSKWSSDWKLKSKAAKKHGAKLLIIVSNDLQALINNNRRQLVNRVTQLGDHGNFKGDGVNTIFLSPKVAQSILGSFKDEIIKKRDQLLNGQKVGLSSIIPSKTKATFDINRSVLNGQNVLGFIEGSDKKEEVVVVSAHYDHIGKKGEEVYNGADDNASGTTTVLEIAEALATAKKIGEGPKRSVLCLLVTGEEKGLLGSEYYAQNPIFPISNTVVDVNIDMVGRWDTEYIAEEQPYIYVIGSDRLSMDLHDINEDINQRYSNLLLDYKYNDEKDPNRFYFRSDHYNFAKHGIPSIFYFNGVHADYHRLGDTPDKIDLVLMQHRARHIFQTIWELANRKERIRLIEQGETSP